ncbi:hypothetical protein HK098_001297 [Nowakowskiella sp. JEL0407]|nr:hypothetical protein HK098_001297 [Nowakowskiella sp. JEL0407]
MFSCCCPNGLPPWLGGSRLSQPTFDYDEIDDLEFENLLAGNSSPANYSSSRLSYRQSSQQPYGQIFGTATLNRVNTRESNNRYSRTGENADDWWHQIANLFRYRRHVNFRRNGGASSSASYVGANLNGDFEDLFDDQEDAELISQEQIRRMTGQKTMTAEEIRRQEEFDYQESQRALSGDYQPETKLIDLSPSAEDDVAEVNEFGQFQTSQTPLVDPLEALSSPSSSSKSPAPNTPSRSSSTN